ncbi:nuclear transport factor 2 family protein [Streptomyces sp. LP11]|uniref:Nuclear transport factor 2 family protein n=1 Tax=Streptomyces pyxinicus TaxID=2970331 RepID=A0ABT2B3L0_9ACTN|nr:nuclear transport factor 2 family protein [Streptomyces sp. LP11]MCS0603082.1 nuclear transport factor 2 family protein [Streptomyces sp. LP11]
MTDVPDGAGIGTTDVPGIVRRYPRAHHVGDAVAATALFTPDATVTDDGRAHRGTDRIEAWLRRATSAYTYTYTTTFLRAEHTGDGRDRELIRDLVIEP